MSEYRVEYHHCPGCGRLQPQECRYDGGGEPTGPRCLACDEARGLPVLPTLPPGPAAEECE